MTQAEYGPSKDLFLEWQRYVEVGVAPVDRGSGKPAYAIALRGHTAQIAEEWVERLCYWRDNTLQYQPGWRSPLYGVSAQLLDSAISSEAALHTYQDALEFRFHSPEYRVGHTVGQVLIAAMIYRIPNTSRYCVARVNRKLVEMYSAHFRPKYFFSGPPEDMQSIASVDINQEMPVDPKGLQELILQVPRILPVCTEAPK